MSALKLPTTLMHTHANDCLAQWVALLPQQAAGDVRVDASALSEFDSSALAVLLGLRRVLTPQGRRLHVDGMPPRLRELASLYGVVALLEPA